MFQHVQVNDASFLEILLQAKGCNATCTCTLGVHLQFMQVKSSIDS